MCSDISIEHVGSRAASAAKCKARAPPEIPNELPIISNLLRPPPTKPPGGLVEGHAGALGPVQGLEDLAGGAQHVVGEGEGDLGVVELERVGALAGGGRHGRGLDGLWSGGERGSEALESGGRRLLAASSARNGSMQTADPACKPQVARNPGAPRCRGSGRGGPTPSRVVTSGRLRR